MQSYDIHISYGQRCFFPRRAFLLTAAAPTRASWFYRSLPLFSFVLHVFLHYCIGNDCGMCNMPSVYARLMKVQSWQGRFLCYLLLRILFRVFEVAGYDMYTPWLSGTPTILIIDWGIRLNDQAFCIFQNDWINCWDAVHAILCLSHCVMG